MEDENRKSQMFEMATSAMTSRAQSSRQYASSGEISTYFSDIYAFLDTQKPSLRISLLSLLYLCPHGRFRVWIRDDAVGKMEMETVLRELGSSKEADGGAWHLKV